MSNQIKVMHCDCDRGDGAKYQDSKYGKNKRVHNPGQKGYKCTVCGKLKTNSLDK